MKNSNSKKSLLVLFMMTALMPAFAHEIVVASSDISVYEEGEESLNLGKRVWGWNAAEDASIPDSSKVNFKNYCEVKPLAGGKEFLVAASEGGWAIVDREKRKAREWGVCGIEVFSIEKISDDVLAVSGRDEKSQSGCVFLIDLKNRNNVGRFVFDKPRGLHWEGSKSFLWVLDAGILTGCKFERASNGTFSLTRAKIISLVDKGSGLGCDLRPLPKSTNTVLSVSMKESVRFIDLKKMTWLANRTTIPADAVNSYDVNKEGKAFFVRLRKDGTGSDVMEKRMWGRKFVPFKKLKGVSIRRARWVQ